MPLRSRFIVPVSAMVLLSLAVPACGSGASVDRVWGLDAGELAESLAAGIYEPLNHVSFANHRLGEIDRLGSDAAYAVALIYLELGVSDVAEELLRHAVDGAPEPWRREAFRVLADHLAEQERYAELLDLAAGLAAEVGEEGAPGADAMSAGSGVSGPGIAYDAALAKAEALYELDRDAEVEEFLSEIRPVLTRELPASGQQARELALWWAVSRAELRSRGWQDDLRSLFRDLPAAHEHSRTWVYVINHDEVYAEFDSSELTFFRAKQLASEGRMREAADLFIALATDASVSDAGRELVRSGWGILDLYRTAAAAGRFGAGAEALRALGDSDPEGAARAYEYAGRLYRLGGGFAAAIPLLDLALAQPLAPEDARRLSWYRLSARVRTDPSGTAAALATIVPTLNSPSYFSDVFVELAGLIAERERWDLILTAYQALVDFATPGTLARYEIILARALETGRIPAAPGRAEELRVRYLERAAAQREDPFSALMASALLGRDGREALALAPAEDVASAEPVITSRVTLLGETYLAYGLLDELFATVRGAGADAGESLIRRASRRLADDGRYRESVLLAGAISRGGDGTSRDVAERRYPLAYATMVDRRADEEGIDRWVFYALLREESLFDPEIASVAGAVGLAQLMPATAEDIARRMGLDGPVLTDPSDNIAIGARYFSLLTEQFGSIARAIAAYNGGQGNVRRWERRTSPLDEVLFHQAVPFPETYNHVRKVVVSAAYYGYLYADRSPADTVRLVFNLE